MSSKAMGLLLMPEAEPQFVEADGEKWTAQELHTIVDGYIELVPLGSRILLAVNEDGHSRKLPLNRIASGLMLGILGQDADIILGTALVIERADVD